MMVKMDFVHYLIPKLILAGKSARWSLQLSEFDIQCITPIAIKSQVVIDMLVAFSSNEDHETNEEMLGEMPETVCTTEVMREWWMLHFDGSSTSTSGGA